MRRKILSLVSVVLILLTVFSVCSSALSWKYTTSSGKVWTEGDDANPEVRQTVYNYLVSELGLNTAAASAILGNIYCECGFEYWLTGNYNGLCQWERSSRWAQCVNKYGDSLEGQLKFIKWELTEGEYQNVYNALLQIPNTQNGVYDAEKVWRNKYERCGEQATRRRQTAAIAYFNYYTNNTNTYNTVPSTTAQEETTTEKDLTVANAIRQKAEASETTSKLTSEERVTLDVAIIKAFKEAKITEIKENIKNEPKEETTKAEEFPDFEGSATITPKKISALAVVNILMVIIQFFCLVIL